MRKLILILLIFICADSVAQTIPLNASKLVGTWRSGRFYFYNGTTWKAVSDSVETKTALDGKLNTSDTAKTSASSFTSYGNFERVIKDSVYVSLGTKQPLNTNLTSIGGFAVAAAGATGLAGSGFGSGGGGARNGTGATARAGGAGATGVVIIEY